MLTIFLINLAVVMGALVVLWLISLPIKNASIVDIFWGCGFVLIAWVSLSIQWLGGQTPALRAMILAGLVTVWGLRLAIHLARRNHGKGEDYRYAEMREHHGKWFPLVSLLTVFGLQGVLMWVIAFPVQAGTSYGDGFIMAMVAGIALWATGLFFEAVGDYQLAQFKADPENKGKVMNRGLWRYTRHPNYFGDFLVWWGFYLVSLESGFWWWTILGPLIMSFLLMRVSGVTLLEKSLKRKLAGYEEYVRRTSSFFPMPPKSSA